MTTKQERDLRLLDFICTFLFGEQWQTPLARALKLNPRTVRGWVQGRNNITDENWRSIDQLVVKKLAHTDNVRERMKRKIDDIAIHEVHP